MNDASSIVNYFYFADHLLVTDGITALTKSPFESFREVKPYHTVTSLSYAGSAYCGTAGEYTLVEESGVRIMQRADNSWVLESVDKEYPCTLVCSPNYREIGAYYNENHSGVSQFCENFYQLVRIACESLMTFHEGISLHAACVEYSGKAFLFTAPSGTGKSTQASAWVRTRTAKLISGDRPHLRLKQDSAWVYGIPWDGKEQCFVQDTYPITAIVEVRQAASNSIRRLSRSQAFYLLAQQAFMPMWDDSAKFKVFQSLRTLSACVPMFRLFCNLDEKSVDLLDDVLFFDSQEKIGEEASDMRIKEGFIVRKIMDEWIVMPKGNNSKSLSGALVLNDTSAYLWNKLETPISKEDLTKLLLDNYEIEASEADHDISIFLEQLRSMDILEETV